MRGGFAGAADLLTMAEGKGKGDKSLLELHLETTPYLH